MRPRATILVVEDDSAMRDLLEDELRDARYDVVTAAGGEAALEQLGRVPVSAVVTDLQMPGMTGAELLDQIRLRHPGVPVVIITAFGTIDLAVQAIKAGAYHFVAKPFRMEELLVTLSGALEENREMMQLETLADFPPLDSATGFVAESLSMRRVLGVIRRAMPVATPVLLNGETGTGKGLVARFLHEGNKGRTGRFVPVNAAEIPAASAEAILWGTEETAGLLREAEGGTIYLEEVELFPAPIQARLVRTLQEKAIIPAGNTEPVPIDVRIIASSSGDLDAQVASGKFRRDLYLEMNVVAIRLPPLRDRKEDLLRLVAHFLRLHGERLGRPNRSLAPEAFRLLKRHDWPGNVQELGKAIERALVLGQSPILGVEEFEETLRGQRESATSSADVKSVALVEREHILRTLETVEGNKAAAARLLGLDRKTLYRKLRLYKIHS